MGFPINIGIKRPFNTCVGVYSWNSWQIRCRFVVKPWINESPNELTIPTNAYESITIQLRCLRMHYEFVTNQLRFLESGVRGQNFEQLQTFPTNSRSLKNWKNWLRINLNQLRTSRTDYDSTTNPKMYQFVAISWIRGRGLCGIGAFNCVFVLMIRGLCGIGALNCMVVLMIRVDNLHAGDILTGLAVLVHRVLINM